MFILLSEEGARKQYTVEEIEEQHTKEAKALMGNKVRKGEQVYSKGLYRSQCYFQ